MRRISRKARILAALPLLLVLQGQHAGPDECRHPSESEPMIEPLYFVPAVAAGRPVALAPDVVLAREVAHIARRGLMLGDEVALPAPGPLLYPAGTPLLPSSIGGARQLCLPDAPGLAEPRRPTTRLRIPCATDADGDGAYEEIEVFGTDPRMQAMSFSLEREIRLPVPVRLVDDPQGLQTYRRHIHRRVRVAEMQESTARLVVEHAFHLQYHGRPDAFVATPTGVLAFQPVRPGAELLGGTSFAHSFRVGREGSPVVELADGAVAEAGGLRFRIARDGRGWTMTPLADRFPRWIDLRCDGRHIVLGAPDAPP